MSVVSSRWEESLKRSRPTSLPDEIVTDILSRLPVETIYRFKCACKAWCILFGESYFVQKHLTHAIADGKECLLLRHIPGKAEDENDFREQNVDMILNPEWEGPPEDFLNRYFEEVYSFRSKQTFQEIGKLEAPKPDIYHSVVGSINGILCLVESDSVRTRPKLNVSLWNPAIREFRTLPKIFLNRYNSPSRVVGIGFAYNQNKDEYKVVCILNSTDSSTFTVKVFSLISNCWKEADADISGSFGDPVAKVYLHDRLHWLVDDPLNHLYFVYAFDIVEEEFVEIMLPNFHSDMNRVMLRESPPSLGDQSLAVFICNHFEGLHVWHMKEYGNDRSWTKLYFLSQRHDIMYPIGFFDNGDVVLANNENSEIVCFSPADSKYRNLDIYAPAGFANYVESLVSVRGKRAPNNVPRALTASTSVHRSSTALASVHRSTFTAGTSRYCQRKRRYVATFNRSHWQ